MHDKGRQQRGLWCVLRGPTGHMRDLQRGLECEILGDVLPIGESPTGQAAHLACRTCTIADRECCCCGPLMRTLAIQCTAFPAKERRRVLRRQAKCGKERDARVDAASDTLGRQGPQIEETAMREYVRASYYSMLLLELVLPSPDALNGYLQNLAS